MLTTNTAFSVRFSPEKQQSAVWKCLTGWPRKNWRGEALLSVDFLRSGDSLWAWESLLLTQMKLHDFLPHAQIACHTRAFLSRPLAAKSNSALTSRRLCFNVFCSHLRLLSSAHFSPPAHPDKREASLKVRCSVSLTGLRFFMVNQRSEAVKNSSALCCLLHFLFRVLVWRSSNFKSNWSSSIRGLTDSSSRWVHHNLTLV